MNERRLAGRNLVRLARPLLMIALAGFALAACESSRGATGTGAKAGNDDGAGDGGSLQSAAARPGDAELRAADRSRGEWLTHGRTYHEERFSPLEQIDAASIGRLGLAFATPIGTTRGMEATPLVMDGDRKSVV